MRLPCRLRHALLCLLLALPSQSVLAVSGLREALDRAWERAVQARVAESRRGEAEASRVAAESLFPAPPTIGIAQRDDRRQRNQGLRERELELAMPLWLPGQRDARQALAGRETEDGEALLAATRLALAGELRAAVWAHAGAQAEVELLRERLALAVQLESDVSRREAAGDLARTDLLLAREETLAARGALATAQGRERQAWEQYRLLTGLEQVPAVIEESPVAATAVHPRQALAQAAAERARAEMQLARESRRDAPELSLGWQQSREDFAAADRNSLRIGLRIPFSSVGRNAPRIAAANSGLIRAEAEYRQTEAELVASLRNAEAALDSAAQTDAAAQARTALASERLRHLQRAFDLGELSLAELVRTRSAANEARLDASRARIAHAAARAQMNQAKGILP